MSLRTMFGMQETAVAIYRRDLIAAVKDGDPARLQNLLKTNIDAPPETLNDPLERAVNKNQVRLADILLNAPGTRQLNSSVLRSVVYNGNTDMFRLLTDKGFDFAACTPSEQGASYVSQLRYMKKDFECDKLRRELEAAKTELTTLRRNAGLPPLEETPAPRDFRL
ncbi:MAG: hypothetical protein PW788_04745 [Micavibrio sp.]|nr:hypothetical protein [Micavibrio sp.]